MTTPSRPVGPEHRPSRVAQTKPPVRPDTRQQHAHDAFADVPGTDTPEPAPRGIGETPDELRDRLRADVGAREQLEGTYAPGVDALRVPATTQGEATPDPITGCVPDTAGDCRANEHYLRIAHADGSMAWTLHLDPALIADLDSQDGPVAVAGYRLAGAYSIADHEPAAGVYVITPPSAARVTAATAVLHSVGHADIDAERERAARWASELAEAERALGEQTGAVPDDDAVGAPLRERLAAAFDAAYTDGTGDGQADGRRLATNEVTVDVLTRAIRRVLSRPSEAVDDEHRLLAERLREELVAVLGWPA